MTTTSFQLLLFCLAVYDLLDPASLRRLSGQLYTSLLACHVLVKSRRITLPCGYARSLHRLTSCTANKSYRSVTTVATPVTRWFPCFMAKKKTRVRRVCNWRNFNRSWFNFNLILVALILLSPFVFNGNVCCTMWLDLMKEWYANNESGVVTVGEVRNI